MPTDLAGTLSGGLDPAPTQEQSAGDATQNAIAAGQQSNDMLGSNLQDVLSAENLHWTLKSDGSATIDTDQQTVQTIMGVLKNYSQITKSFQEQISRTQQQEARVQANPILNVLTQVAGQMGAAKNMPPIVQALGRSSLALNPTLQQLQGQEMQQEMGLSEVLGRQAQAAGQLENIERMRQMRAKFGLETEKMGLEREREARLAKGPEERMELQKEKGREAMERATLPKPTKMPAAAKPGKPLGKDSLNWKNSEGKPADPRWTLDQAVENGYFPQEKPKTPAAAEVTKTNAANAALKLLQQMDDLVPTLDRKGFLAKGPGFWQDIGPEAKRKFFSKDKDLNTWAMHASTMVAAARAVGDLGARAQAAYDSLIDVVKHPSTAEGVKQAINQLREAIYAAYPSAKTKGAADANDPLGIR